jgi:transposase
MNAVAQLGQEEVREEGKEHKELFKPTRFLWLKNPWNLSDKEKTQLSALEKLNLKINRANLLKEAFRDSWSYSKSSYVSHYLEKWFWWVPIQD